MINQPLACTLNQAKSWQQAILDNSDFIIFSTNLKGIIQTLNKGALRKLGYQPENIIGKKTPALFHDEQEVKDRALQLSQELGLNIETYFEAFAAKARLGIVDENVWTFIRKDFTRFLVYLSVTALRDESGNLTGFLGIGKDVTTLQNIQHSLYESEAKFSAAFQYAAIGMALISLDGRWLTVNPALCKLVGYPETELLSKSIKAVTHCEDVALDQHELEQLIARQIDHYHFEKRLVNKQGQVIWVSLNVSLVWGDDNQPLYYLAQIQDISQRKQDEAQLVELNKNLEELVSERTELFKNAYDQLKISEANYQELYDDAPDMYLSFDVHSGRILQCNQTTCKMLGCNKQEILGQSIHNLCHTGCLPTLEIALEKLLDEEEVRDVQLQLSKENGTKLEVSLNMKAVRDPAGNILYGHSTWRDITSYKQLETDLKNAIKKTEVASRAKSQFLANMSHELRTPLNAIMGFSQLLLKDNRITPDQRNNLNLINGSGEHLLSLINDVLTMSKIEAGSMSYLPKDVNLTHLCEGIHELFAMQAESKDLNLQFHIESDVPQFVTTDAKKLRQILINLVGNALKFTERGSVNCSVRLGKYDPNAQTQQLHFIVRDTGLGIPEPLIKDLFEPFTQNPLTREKYGGTGLGLPICKEFVQLLGGEITVYSREGQGTEVHFDIQVESCEPINQTDTCQQQVVGLAEGHDSPRILVVEDQPENRHLLVMLLETVGFDVKEATNGQEAIELNQAWRPDLIWMDIRMPLLNGIEATQMIKAGANPPVIIALTAQAFAEDEQAALAAGCDGYVHKPYKGNTIFEKMSQYLDVRYQYQPCQAKGLTNVVNSLTTTMLATMPLDWVQRLYDAAIRLDEKSLDTLVKDIPIENQALHSSLNYLISSYSFEPIMTVTQTVLKSP